MAISVIGTPLSFQDDPSGDLTQSYMSGAGTDRLLVVCEQVVNFNSTGVTFNGSPLTLAVNADNVAKIWYLTNPPATTANVVVSYDSGAIDIKGLGVITLAGVDQSTPTGNTSNTSGAAGTDAFLSIVTSAFNSWVIDSLGTGGVTTPIPDLSQTEFQNTSRFGASYKIVGGPGSVNMAWTLNSSNPWDHAAVEIIEAGGGGPSLLLLLNARGDN